VNIDVVPPTDALRDEWSRLAHRLQAPPFLHPSWITAWWDAFGNGAARRVVVVHRGPALSAVLPLGGRRGVWHSPTNWHSEQFGVLAEDVHSATLAADSFLSLATWAGVIDFVDLDDRWTLAALDAASSLRGYLSHVTLLQQSPYIDVDRGWAEFCDGLDRKVVREIDRRGRRLAEGGSLAIEVADGKTGLEGALDECFKVEALSWKGTANTAIVSRPETERFYRSIASWAAELGWLRLGLLRLDGRLLAFDLALEAHGVHYLLKTGYDPEFRRFGVGMLLRKHMLARVFDACLKRYEFLGASAPWKQQWTAREHLRLRVSLYPPTWPGRVSRVAEYARPLARRAVKVVAASARRSPPHEARR
jgi:CelD/BcsL family acetyltransferase involved in cellulose biosynthesis